MKRLLFQWRGMKLYSYPAMLYLGVVFGVIGGTFTGALHGLDPARVSAAMLFLVLPAMVGARMLFVALHWKAFRDRPVTILRRSEGGAALFGGLVPILLLSLPLLGRMGISIGAFWDAGAVTLLIGMIFTRFGCLLNGCCAGRRARGFLTLYLPNNRGEWRRRLPTPLFEAGIAAVLLLASLWTWNRMPFGGALFLANLAAYGTARWLLDPTREAFAQDIAVRRHRIISAGMVAMSIGTFLIVWLFAPYIGWNASPGITESARTHAIGINSPYVWLTPLAVLAVLSLFHSIGCDLVFIPAPDYNDDYQKNVLGETNSPTIDPANSVCVAYWRLRDPGPDVAEDEKLLNDGTFQTVTLPPLPDPALDPDHSPTTDQPVGTITFKAVSLLGADSNAHSIEVNGGFMSVPPTNVLNLPQFTIEALLFPEWDTFQHGRWYCVIEHTSPVGNKKFGIAIYAGPESAGAVLNTPYRWQVWLGVTDAGTTKFTQIKPVTPPSRPIPQVEPNKANYVAVTYDGSIVRLYATFEGKFSSSADITQENLIAVEEPLTFAPNQEAIPFQIGMGRDLFQPFNTAGDPRYPFDGRIQEIAVYSQALTPDRIASHIGAIQWADL